MLETIIIVVFTIALGFVMYCPIIMAGKTTRYEEMRRLKEEAVASSEEVLNEK